MLGIVEAATFIQKYCSEHVCAKCPMFIQARYFDYCGFSGHTECPQDWEVPDETKEIHKDAK